MPDDITRSRYELKVEFHLARIGVGTITAQDPGLITDAILDSAWQTMGDFVIDMFDELGIEPTDEEYRQAFVEVCYRILYREFYELETSPLQEQSWKERIGTGKTGARARRKSPYDDTWGD